MTLLERLWVDPAMHVKLIVQAEPNGMDGWIKLLTMEIGCAGHRVLTVEDVFGPVRCIAVFEAKSEPPAPLLLEPAAEEPAANRVVTACTGYLDAVLGK